MFFLTLLSARRAEARIAVAAVGVALGPVLMQRLADIAETNLKAACPVRTGALRARLRVFPSIGGTLRLSGLVYLASTHWRGRSSGWIDRGLRAAEADANARLALFDTALGERAAPVAARTIRAPGAIQAPAIRAPAPAGLAPLPPQTAALTQLPALADLPPALAASFAAVLVHSSNPPPAPPPPPPR